MQHGMSADDATESIAVEPKSRPWIRIENVIGQQLRCRSQIVSTPGLCSSSKFLQPRVDTGKATYMAPLHLKIEALVMPGSDRDTLVEYVTTRWTLIEQAKSQDTAIKKEAASQIDMQYYPALRAHLVRRRGLQTHDADEILQRFATDKILERNLVASATADGSEAGAATRAPLTALPPHHPIIPIDRQVPVIDFQRAER